MKKALFGLAILTAGLVMVSCGGNKSAKTEEQPAAAEQTKAEEAQAQAAETFKTEDRAWYTVDITSPWKADQYVSEMTVKKEGAELNFKEQAKSDVAKWVENISKAAESKLSDITTGDITWNVFKNAQNFKTVYVAQVKDGVVRVGSSLEDANDAEVLKILQSVKAK